MSRRRFLSGLSTLGLSGAALNHITQDAVADLTDNPEKEVPRLEGFKHTNQKELRDSSTKDPVKPEKEPIYYTIPRDQWAHTEASMDAARRISNRFDSPLIDAGVTHNAKGFKGKRAIIVRFQRQKVACGCVDKDERVREPDIPIEKVRAEVPNNVAGTAGNGKNKERIEGFPVVVEERTRELDIPNSSVEYAADDPFFNDKYRPVASGSAFSIDGRGTLATPVWDGSVSEKVMLTCGHCTGGDRGNIAHQPAGSGDRIGVTTGDGFETPDFEGGTINLDDRLDASYELAGLGGGTSENYIIGTLGWDKLADEEGNSDYLLTLQGSSSGLMSGKIVEIYPNQTYREVVHDGDAIGGDSGAPVYHLDSNDNAMISHVHAWSSKTSSGGTFIHDIEDALDVSV